MKDRAAGSAGDVSLRDVTEGDLDTFFLDQLDTDAGRMAAFPARNIVSWTQDGEREVGYWIGKRYWGRGVATRALSEFLREVPERPLFAHVATHNLGSLRVLEKCGFTVSVETMSVEGDEVEGDEVDEVRLELRDQRRRRGRARLHKI